MVRTLATNELVDRIGASCVPLVRARVQDKASPSNQKVHGLWVLERLGALDEKLVQQLLEDSDRTVRVHMIKALAERGASQSSRPLTELVRGKLTDKDAFVRRAAADCLGQHPDSANVKPLLELWSSTPERGRAADPHHPHGAARPHEADRGHDSRERSRRQARPNG